MKKLSLLISLFLLISGFIFPDISFSPSVAGSARVTWGYDIDHGNSGFSSSTSTSFDLGVSVDPFNARTGEGIYGEVEITGLSVTLKSNNNPLVDSEFQTTDSTRVQAPIVSIPKITARLYFAQDLYLRVATAAATDFTYANPLGKMIVYDKDNKQEGSWYDTDEDYNNSTVNGEWGETGYGLSYVSGPMTFNVDFISEDPWGSDDGDDVEFDGDDTKGEFSFTALDIAPQDGYISSTEYAGAEAALDAFVNSKGADNSYDLVWVYNQTVGDQVLVINEDKEVLLAEYDEDGNFLQNTYTIDVTGEIKNSSLYSAAFSINYVMDGIGTFDAYVLPSHSSHEEMFTGLGIGFKAKITAVEILGLDIGADFHITLKDEIAGVAVAEEERFEYEIAVGIPLSISDLLSVNLRTAMTDNKSDDSATIDIYGDAALGFSGVTLGGAVMISDLSEDTRTGMFRANASYRISVPGGTLTPSVSWIQNMVLVDDMEDDMAKMTLSIAAGVVSNTLFTLKYNSEDLLADDIGLGVITFETKLSF